MTGRPYLDERDPGDRTVSRIERLIQKLAGAIVAERVITEARADRDAWQTRARAQRRELTVLHREMRAALAELQGCTR